MRNVSVSKSAMQEKKIKKIESYNSRILIRAKKRTTETILS